MSQTMSSNTASALTGMMEDVVTKESPTLAIDGVKVATRKPALRRLAQTTNRLTRG